MASPLARRSEQAIEAARDAASALTTEELRSYRALWLYFGTSWAAERAELTGEEADASFARELKRELEFCARTLSFVPRVAVADPPPAPGPEHQLRADRAARALLRLHLRGRMFEARIAEFLERLTQNDATQFELGLEQLGKLLGFESLRPNEEADPDGIWRDGDRQWLLLEAKTEVQPPAPSPPTRSGRRRRTNSGRSTGMTGQHQRRRRR